MAIGGVVGIKGPAESRAVRVLPVVYHFSRVWPEIYASPSSELAIATTDHQGALAVQCLAGLDARGGHFRGASEPPRACHLHVPCHGWGGFAFLRASR